MKNLKFYCILFVLLAPCTALNAQVKYTLEGLVYDEQTNQTLPGVSIYIPALSQGTAADENGYFSIAVMPGKYNIIFSYVGYEDRHVEVTADRSQHVNVYLNSLASDLQEVVITDRRPDEKLTETETGLITLNKKEMETLPYLMGETDPIRIIQLMPGVHTAGEGNTGFYVRGGAVDQNLILLDNATVYNPSHLFGFFSVFNGSVIDNIDLYKSGIPANYGGRLSSIAKINTRQGNNQKITGEGSVGLLSTSGVVEGPIKKNRGSFLIAGRRTYIDLFIDPLRDMFSVEEKVDYYFYDLNINADYRLSDNNHLRLRAYNGKDNFDFSTGSSFSNRIKWGNTTASLSWIHRFNDDFSGELSLNTVRYDMDFGASINTYQFNIFSDIRDYGLAYQFDLKRKNHNIAFGLNSTYHRLTPNNVRATSEDVELDFNKNVKLFSGEASVFINDKITLSDRIELNAGLRFAAYSQRGPFTRYLVDANLQIIDTVNYRKNTQIVDYGNLEPRIALRYKLHHSSALKISYDKSYQYLHMSPLSSASLPMDVWVTSSTEVKPQSADQFSAGYFRNFFEHTLETSLVVYYKTMLNQIEYRDGVIIGYSKGFNYDDNFVYGKGTSYGVELLIRKSKGRINGMLAYTLAKTLRNFKDLNKGKSFPAKYDRLHDISLFGNYLMNKHWTFSGVFVYGTGNALNLPIARYIIQGNVVNEYGSRNSFRMPAYHRLDLAATYKVRKSKRFESEWIFSVYNVYNRRNPYYIYFETQGDLADYKLETNLKQVSLFPVLPSVSYRFKF